MTATINSALIESARASVTATHPIPFEPGSPIDQFIIQRSADREIAATKKRVVELIEAQLAASLSSLLAPKFQFSHVLEAGLRIWGKTDNVAMSRTTLKLVLDGLTSTMANPAVLDSALFHAGRASAIQFFDQFRSILSCESARHYPPSVVEFLQLLGAFDKMSAWWDGVLYSREQGYVASTIKRPFWRYPWLDPQSHRYSTFYSGYLRALYNAASDYLRVVGDAVQSRARFDFAIQVNDAAEPDPNDSYYRVIVCDQYSSDLATVDLCINYLAELLSLDQHTKEHLVREVARFVPEVLKGIATAINRDLQ